jgi:hypothetical protein
LIAVTALVLAAMVWWRIGARQISGRERLRRRRVRPAVRPKSPDGCARPTRPIRIRDLGRSASLKSERPPPGIES